ncbi:MAG: hypothetical protein ACI9EW_002856 [Cellvibrionaceae bacterium]|jgi:hypothetical protein
MIEKILTLHPEGKKGVNIAQWKYEMVRDAILAVLNEHETFPFKRLTDEVGRRLDDSFEGSVGWYTISVKLDLEARGQIERIPNKSPQEVRLTKE